MKYLLVLALVAIAVARPNKDDDDRRPRPRPHPRGPRVFVKRLHLAAQNESYSFKFGVAGMRPLKESEVHLKKIVKGEKGPKLVDTDFDIKMKTLKGEEIKELIEKYKEEKEDDDKDNDRRPRPRPHPRPHPKHAIVGRVETGDLSCDDQGLYLIHYGDKKDCDCDDDGEELPGCGPSPPRHHDRDDDKDDDRRPRPRPHPRPRRGVFVIKIKGCRRPEPKPEPKPEPRVARSVGDKDDRRPRPRPHPRGPRVFVKRLHLAAQNESYSFKFGVAGMRPLKESEVHLKKIVKGEKGPKLVDTDFDIKMKTLKGEEIKELIEKYKEEKEDDDKDDDKDDDRRPRPRPHPKHAIVGRVETGDLSCDDQGLYLIHYGDKKDCDCGDDGEELPGCGPSPPRHHDRDDKDDDRRPRPRPHPRPRRGVFVIKIKGCRRPEPKA